MLIKIRKEATPDFFSFMANLDYEEANFIWIMFLWIIFKCSLRLDDSSDSLMSSNVKIESRIKIAVRGLIELFVALSISHGLKYFDDKYAWLYCLSLYGLTCLRSVYLELFDLVASVFVSCYILQNLIVNIIDWLLFNRGYGSYQDLIF